MDKHKINILAIDPGPSKSAFVLWDGSNIVQKEIIENKALLTLLKMDLWQRDNTKLVIEWIESYGMPVGQEVFLTCRWCGRFEQAWGAECHYMPRKEVKLALCHSTRAKDSNVRQALMDIMGAPGTKKNPGKTYGLKADLWAALALAWVFGTTHSEVAA